MTNVFLVLRLTSSHASLTVEDLFNQVTININKYLTYIYVYITIHKNGKGK